MSHFANPSTPFHLAFPVHDLAAARAFYGELLGCPEGRSSANWVDFNFYGHQIVAHLAPSACADPHRCEVDGKQVPLRHFGAVLSLPQWQALADKLAQAGTPFVLPPQRRFQGEPAEQATLFVRDPSGNALEFKALATPDQLFAL